MLRVFYDFLVRLMTDCCVGCELGTDRRSEARIDWRHTHICSIPTQLVMLPCVTYAPQSISRLLYHHLGPKRGTASFLYI